MALMIKESKAPVGATLVVVSSFFYASYGIWTKLMGNFFDGFTSAAIRSLAVLLILFPFAAAYRKLEPLNLRKNWPYIVGMIIGSIFVWGSLYYAILHAGVGISLAISYLGIIIGSFLFGWLFAGERFTRDKALAATLGALGLVFIFYSSVSHSGWVALVAALTSGIAGGANSVFSKKIHYNALQSTMALWASALIANLSVIVILSRPLPVIGWHIEWFYMLIFVLVSIVASVTFVAGIKLVEAGAAGILGLLEIVFGVIFGVLFFSERPNIITMLGMTVIVAAAAIPYLKDYNAKRGTLD
jgi:drug/metabolite transporter (DMT)-like permease